MTISKIVVITQGGIEYSLEDDDKREYTDAEYRQIVTNVTLLYSHYPAIDSKGRSVMLSGGFLMNCVYRHDLVEV